LFLLYPTKNNARVVNLAVVGLAPGYICWWESGLTAYNTCYIHM
jgi:hypothetical protein